MTRKIMRLGLGLVSLAVLTGGSNPPAGAPQVGISSPVDNATLWGRVFATGSIIDPDSGATINKVTVTLDYGTSSFSTSKYTKAFSRCTDGAYRLDCANPGAADTDDNQFTLDGNGDFSYSRKPLANIKKITVKATDNTNTSGEDNVPVKYDICATQTNPNYGSQTYANNTWQGDFKACGQNVGTYFLKYDFNGNPVTINRITGSLILSNTIINNLADADATQQIDQDLVIRGHHYLTNLSGINQAMVGKRVTIYSNYNLTDVSALFSAVTMAATTPTTIEITDNANLPTCSAKQLVDDLRAAGWVGDALIRGNKDPDAVCP